MFDVNLLFVILVIVELFLLLVDGCVLFFGDKLFFDIFEVLFWFGVLGFDNLGNFVNN